MVEKKERWFNNGWVVSIGSGIVILVLPAIWDIVAKQPYYTTIGKMWYGILWLLNFQIPVWCIIVFIISAIAVLYFVTKLNSKSEPSEILPDFLNYKSDILKKWKWSWDYHFNYQTKEWDIVNLVPVCQMCKIKMLDYSDVYSSSYVCPSCDSKVSNDILFNRYWESEDAIEALIIDNIEKGRHLSTS